VSGATAAFVYLSARTLRNRALAQVRRLRSPRYVIAVAVACGYLLLLLYRPGGSPVELPTGVARGSPGGTDAGLELLSACALALFTAKWWLLGSANSALAFTPAEVQLLFPAPLRRRTLVLYKIGRSQLALLISALLITVLARRAGSPLPSVLRVVSLWVLFCTIALHQMAAALVRAGAAQRGRGLRRNIVPLVVVGSGLVLLAWIALRAWPGARGIGDLPAALGRVSMAFRSPPASDLLAPFRLALAPSYAETAHVWLVALGPALALLAIHVIWVLRADYVFEDAAVEASARRAAHLAALRARAAGAAVPTPRMVDTISGSMAAVRLDRPPPSLVRPRHTPFPLDPTGDPAVALLWKNIIALVRGTRLRTVLLVSVILGTTMLAARELGVPTPSGRGGGFVLLGTMAFVAAILLIVLGPLAVRNDLRQDLLHIDMLRTYPLRGSVLVFAEIASSTLVLTLIQWMLLGVSYVFLANAPADAGIEPLSLVSATFPGNLTTLAIAIVVLPVINGASFFVQNAAALLFPDWVRLGTGSVGGLEVIGQRLLGFGASLLALTAILAPAALVAAGVLMISQNSAMPSPAALFVAVASGIIVGATEIFVAVQWLGYRFERTDAAAVTPGNRD
jgi:ABC-2 type transport system permease protein